MRNLKKFLALVLAMVMAFSLMLSANAANPVKDFDDFDSITKEFQEAADVLTGMKVFQGDEGGFRPGDTIIRAEVAALIYRLATGDVDDVRAGAYANYGNFTDVNESDWFAGYVGYCANAGYIKGTTPTTFEPYAPVTGYETLAMILRAIGYDKNGEFTGPTWETNVSALATQLGILKNIKTTHYGNTLYLASRRDVVAELLFRADAEVPMVVYTPAFGYQPTGMTGGVVSREDNPTLGEHIFGLANYTGTLIGNQQTGEQNTRLGKAGEQNVHVDGSSITPAIQYSAFTWQGIYDVSDPADITIPSKTGVAATDDAANAELGNNEKFDVETGIDLFGHKVKIWYDNRENKYDDVKGHPTYAYFDKAKTEVVYADNTDLTNPNTDSTVDLSDAIGGTELKVASSKTAVFNNSFGKFGTLETPANIHDEDNDGDNDDATTEDQTDDDEVSLGIGNGVAVNGAAPADQYASPVGLYKIICNNDNNTVDAVIALNIESSQITESNNVNRVPTIGLPVMNWAGTADAPATGALFVEGNKTTVDATAGAKSDNLKNVGGVVTGVLAQDALVGNSAKALGDYEMGIHITGTTRRDVSDNEATAINGQAATKNDLESAYFLLNKVTATVEGTVVAYNRNAGTVTLDNGTVLERSKFYDTVVITNPLGSTANPVSASQAPISAIPQGWVYDSTANDAVVGSWVEGYANTTYKFYTDYEGKYLGAERSYGASFLYGTYLDYDQKTSSSTFNYYLTGVNLNGEVETKQVSKFWAGLDAAGTGVVFPSAANTPNNIKELSITGTNLLGVPFRDTFGTVGSVNGLGEGMYTGFTVNGTTVDSLIIDTARERNEYLVNMARLGVKYAAYLPTAPTNMGDPNAANPAFDIREIDIDKDAITLGARETINAQDITAATSDATLLGTAASTEYTGGKTSNKYFTEGTKFILVSGFGTDSVKAEVYNGISELKGTSSHVFIKMNGANDSNGVSTKIKLNSSWDAEAANQMIYYTESPYTYAQSGDTAMKIDTIILPKAAVSWSGGSGLYYVGDPSYTSINSWGTDAWKYNLYMDGELHQVWLTNDPSEMTFTPGTDGSDNDYNLCKDTFYNLKDTTKKANDGQPIYTAGNYDNNGVWTGGQGIIVNDNPVAVGTANQYTMTGGATADGVRYSAVTRDAQTATFVNYNGTADTTGEAKLYRVAGAKVVNLNKGAKAGGDDTLTVGNKSQSGEIWPGITDLATLNEAGSINPVTGRPLKVAAVVDPDNDLVVTTIYVCWDQDWVDIP